MKAKKLHMAPSPSKKRRTSVGTIQVSTSNKNFEGQNEDKNDRIPGPASYMSPTKASLARSHPHLLPRTEAAPRSKGKLLLEQRISALKSKQSNTNHPPSGKTHVIVQPAVNAEEQEPRASPPEAGNEDFIAPSTQQPPVLERAEVSQADRPAKDFEAGSSAIVESVFPASSGAITTERLTESVDNIHETTNHADNEKPALPSTPVKNAIHEIEPAEPRLPTTPRQLGLEPPARKPTGTLSLSPKPKRKLRRHSSIKSSPLKPKEAAAVVQQTVEIQDESSLGPCRSFSDYASTTSIEKAQDFPLSENHSSGTEFSTIPMRASKDLAASDPLFNLQASLSLAVSASDEIEPIQAEPHGLRSRVVMLNSLDNVLVVKLRMFIKKNSNKVASVVVIQLSPWTSPELGSWLKAPATDRSQGAIAKAISRYWDMAETRAFCWHECEQEFGHLIDSTTEATNHPADIDRSHEKTAVQQNNDMNPVLEKKPTETQKVPSDPGGATPPPPPLLLSQQHLAFSDRIALLHINWTIRFTPSGEATSILSARASYPESWSGEAVYDDLARTGEAFARLVKMGKTVHEAVGALIGVVFPA